MTTKPRLSAQELVREINKEFGENTLVLASEAKGLIKPRVSTGSLSLDLMLGGGYAEGAVTLLEGSEQSSKSWTLNTMAANFLKEHQEALYILVDSEQTNDANFLGMLGVDLDRTYFLFPDSGEQAWDAAIKAASLADKLFIGVDSLDACVPMAELTADVGDHQMAPAARLNNKGFRKLLAAMKSDITAQDPRVTVVFITQLRDNIGAMFGDRSCTVGGRGKKFAATTIIRLTKVATLKDDSNVKDASKINYGYTIEASIVKNKGSGAGDKVRYDLYKENYKGFRRGDIDNVSELIPYLLQFGVASKAGNRIVIDGTSYMEKDLRDKLLGDRDMMDGLVRALKEEHHRRYDADVAAHQRAPAKTAAKAVPLKKQSAKAVVVRKK